jgi:hypothetical protein
LEGPRLPNLDEWERCKRFIADALPYAGGTHELLDIEAGIAAGRFGLIPRERSAFVVEVTVYPQLKALHIFLAGGDLSELKAFDPHMDQIGRSLGCSRITIAGRKGFARALKDLGYCERWTVLAKEI